MVAAVLMTAIQTRDMHPRESPGSAVGSYFGADSHLELATP